MELDASDSNAVIKIQKGSVEMKDYAEMWRPQYHYATLDSSVNDPNGLVYYKGVYHLYYQTWPHQPVRGCNLRDGVLFGVHWGHAVSTDLIHWKEQEEALFPDDLGHMWSGTIQAGIQEIEVPMAGMIFIA